MFKKLLSRLRDVGNVDRWPSRDKMLHLESGLWEVDRRHPKTLRPLVVVFESSEGGPSAKQLSFADSILDSVESYEIVAQESFSARPALENLPAEQLVLDAIEIPPEQAIVRGQFTLIFKHPADEEGSYAAAFVERVLDGIARND